jgi:predicted signal transduction protein with EAL and GGDEF domain
MSASFTSGVLEMKDDIGLNREQVLRCLDIGKALTSELDPNRLLEKIIDIDNFKTVVDSEGHLNGSRTLRDGFLTL